MDGGLSATRFISSVFTFPNPSPVVLTLSWTPSQHTLTAIEDGTFKEKLQRDSDDNFIGHVIY